jgi:prepilin-type N-terminal cleavage/methylation domain-containing protein
MASGLRYDRPSGLSRRNVAKPRQLRGGKLGEAQVMRSQNTLHQQAPDKRAFTLLEVMIAMSILAIGATSILSVFVAAVSFQTERVEANRITELRNFVRHHAQVVFNNYDPASAKDGEKPIPKNINVDLTDVGSDSDTASAHADPLIREAAEKFPGFRYEILFEEDTFSVSGSSVVAHIRIYRLSGQLDESELVDKEFLTRNGVPAHEYGKSASWGGMSGAERRKDKRSKDPKGGG